jgi:hypothetical protein
MLTINQNQNINLYTPAFRGEPEAKVADRYKGVREQIAEIVIKEEEVIPPPKKPRRVRKLNLEKLKNIRKACSLNKISANGVWNGIENSAKFVGALGKISACFLWNRVKNYGFIRTAVLTAGIVLETGLMLMISHDAAYPKGDRKYDIEKTDKKALKAESYYNRNLEKYYEKTGEVISDYANAILQMEKEENTIKQELIPPKKKK